MEGKLSDEHVKSVLAPWRLSLQSSGFENRLMTALELYEHFPIDFAVTGGSKEANTRLASVLCGLKEEEDSDDEEQDEETDAEETEEEEDEDDEPDSSPVRSTHHVRIVGFTDDSDEESSDSVPMLHPQNPNVRVWTVHGRSAPLQHTYDVMVVLTTELHQEDHMRLTMEQSEKKKVLFLVKAEKETDLVREKLTGPCKTCAWERMQARTLEFQRRHKEAFKSVENTEDHETSSLSAPCSEVFKLWEPSEIADAVLKAAPELRKKVFSQFLVDVAGELHGLRAQSHGKGPLVSTALKIRKIKQEDLNRISTVFQTQDLTDQPSKLLSVLTALEYFRLDIGLLGETGCGSSSLYNALLGLKTGGPGAAPVGVTETTREPRSHPYPGHPNVLLWDLPGIGRVGDIKTESRESALHPGPMLPSGLPVCDVYILLSPLRLQLRHVQLLKHLLTKGKTCYVVISKADQIEMAATEEVKNWSEEVLERFGLKQKVFLVSTSQHEILDFSRMRETLNCGLRSHKRAALASYVTKLVEESAFWKVAYPCKFM